MKKEEMLYNIGLLSTLLKVLLLLPVRILNIFPDSLLKNELIIEKNKISIKLCKIGRVNKTVNDKFYNSIGELLKTGLLEVEECSDKNFHQLTYRKGNIQKYLKSVRINQRIKTIGKQLQLLVEDITN